MDAAGLGQDEPRLVFRRRTLAMAGKQAGVVPAAAKA